MKRVFAAVVVALLLPAVAVASAPSAAHRREYLREYHRAAVRFGKRAPGRNIVVDGRADGRPVSDGDVVRSLGVLERLFAPPPVVRRAVYTPAVQPVASTVTSTVPAPVSSSSGAGGVPSCASESGTNYSTGPDNTNPSSGATGRYQITPGTAAGYGCNLSTPGGQDACAQVVYAHQGAGAWVGCGG